MAESKTRIIKDKFSLLPDTPLDADKESSIRFGHPYIAQAIRKIVVNAESPFTIGLFGKWGSGKSTIINLLSKYLQKDKVLTIKFDAWKYQADSFRRQLLITLDEDLSLELNYKDELNQSLTKPKYLGLGNNILQNLQRSAIPLISIVIVTVLYILARRYLNLTDWLLTSDIINPKIISGVFDFSFFVVVLGFLQNSLQLTYGESEKVRTDSAEGFEDRFYNEVLQKIGKKKLLIVIDNLDRCKSEVATSLLSDIKTFLTNDTKRKNVKTEVIFLIACDHKAIKKHLENSHFDNPTEFLRKFFNATIEIPIFLDLDLDSYTEDLIKNTQIDLLQRDSELIWLITYAFRDNPREIKQFVNTLITQLVLVESVTEGKQLLNPDTIINNIPFLAKTLIIRQKFPNIYTSLEYIVARYGVTWDTIINGQVLTESIHKQYKDEFNEFLEFTRATRSISDDNLLVFLRVGQSKEEIQLPQWPNLVLALTSKDLDASKQIVEEIVKNKELGDLDNLSRVYLRVEHRNSRRSDSTKLMAFGSTLVLASLPYLKKLPKFINNFTSTFLPERASLARSSDFPPQIYLKDVFQVVNKRSKNIIFETFVSPLNDKSDKHISPYVDTDYARGIFKYLSTEENSYISSNKDTLKTAIASNFYTDINGIKILNSTEIGREYISLELADNFVKSIVVEDLDDYDNLVVKLELVQKLRPAFGTVFSKMRLLIDHEMKQPISPEKRFLLLNTILSILVTNQDNPDKDDLNPEDISIISKFVYDLYTTDGDWDRRAVYIKCGYYISKLKDADYRSHLATITREFVSNVPYETFQDISIDLRKKLLESNPSEFRALAIKDLRVFDLSIKELPEAEWHNMITSLIDQSKRVDLSRKEEYFDRIVEIKKTIEPAQVDEFYQQLMTIKPQRPDLAIKYNRRKKLFSKEQKKALATN